MAKTESFNFCWPFKNNIPKILRIESRRDNCYTTYHYGAKYLIKWEKAQPVEKARHLNMFSCSHLGGVKSSVAHFLQVNCREVHQWNWACQGDGRGTLRSCERKYKSSLAADSPLTIPWGHYWPAGMLPPSNIALYPCSQCLSQHCDYNHSCIFLNIKISCLLARHNSEQDLLTL